MLSASPLLRLEVRRLLCARVLLIRWGDERKVWKKNYTTQRFFRCSTDCCLLCLCITGEAVAVRGPDADHGGPLKERCLLKRKRSVTAGSIQRRYPSEVAPPHKCRPLLYGILQLGALFLESECEPKSSTCNYYYEYKNNNNF